MSHSAAKQIKAEPYEDLEQEIPRFHVASCSAPNLPTSVECIDLTHDEYLSEFQNFLGTISDSRKQPGKKSAGQLKHITEVMSLQVAHLQLINFYQEVYVCSLFGIDFKNVMVYGRIVPGTVRHENNTHIYKLDDGSGTVEVHYPHGLKRDLDNLTMAHGCEDILSRRTPLNEEQVPEDANQKADLKLLLGLIKTQCQRRLEYFQLGTRCFAIGRPFMNRFDRVSLYAHSMHADNDPAGKSTEVFWKTHLALCYERKYAAALLS